MRDSATHQMAYLRVNCRSSVAKDSRERRFISSISSHRGVNSPSVTFPCGLGQWMERLLLRLLIVLQPPSGNCHESKAG
jgi:hypothetical protein